MHMWRVHARSCTFPLLPPRPTITIFRLPHVSIHRGLQLLQSSHVPGSVPVVLVGSIGKHLVARECVMRAHFVQKAASRCCGGLASDVMLAHKFVVVKQKGIPAFPVGTHWAACPSPLKLHALGRSSPVVLRRRASQQMPIRSMLQNHASNVGPAHCSLVFLPRRARMVTLPACLLMQNPILFLRWQLTVSCRSP